VDPESSNLSNQVRCSRCRRAPRDDADYVSWEAFDEGAVCPGCLTMLEVEDAEGEASGEKGEEVAPESRVVP